MKSQGLTAVLTVLYISQAAWPVPPTITVTWDENPAPIEGQDYAIDDTDPDFPDVELINASDTWRIYSTDSDNPNSIGDIGDITSPHSENFGVKIQNNSAGAGARVVKSIVLDPTSVSNHSNITGGSTTGNLEGDLTLQQSSGGTGGQVTGTFSLGGVISSAEITIPVVKATFSVDGSLTCPLTISDEIDAATLSIDSNVGSTGSITIADMIGTGSQLTIGGNVAGDIVLQTGIKAGHTVSIAGFLASNGSIDLNGANVAGTFLIVEGGAGVVLTAAKSAPTR